MNRRMYRAFIKRGMANDFLAALEHESTEWELSLIDCGALTSSVYCYDRMLFIYVEAETDNFVWDWPDACRNLLEVWPDRSGVRWSIPMLDVFHDSTLSNLDSHRGERKAEERIGSLAVLRPNMYSSYIFYHYQKQEEQHESFNQTYLIGAHETYLFSYFELPAIKDDRQQMGLLHTKNTPDLWHEVMYPHFIPWHDAAAEEKVWRRMEILFSY
ncbi:MAG: hypothetical protein JWN30_2416 [Bacilli bacterium]|nr:hypothetical protein [Bacilli bacterium]